MYVKRNTSALQPYNHYIEVHNFLRPTSTLKMPNPEQLAYKVHHFFIVIGCRVKFDSLGVLGGALSCLPAALKRFSVYLVRYHHFGRYVGPQRVV